MQALLYSLSLSSCLFGSEYSCGSSAVPSLRYSEFAEAIALVYVLDSDFVCSYCSLCYMFSLVRDNQGLRPCKDLLSRILPSGMFA